MSNNCKCKCFSCSDHDMSYVSPPACRYLPSGVCHPSDVGRSKVRAMRSPPWQPRWFKDICYNSLEIASVLCCKSAGEQFFVVDKLTAKTKTVQTGYLEIWDRDILFWGWTTMGLWESWRGHALNRWWHRANIYFCLRRTAMHLCWRRMLFSNRDTNKCMTMSQAAKERVQRLNGQWWKRSP